MLTEFDLAVIDFANSIGMDTEEVYRECDLANNLYGRGKYPSCMDQAELMFLLEKAKPVCVKRAADRERMLLKTQVRKNAEKDPDYCPYCLPCPSLVRMKKIEPFLWKCADCGATHDERIKNDYGQEALQIYDSQASRW